MVHLRVYHVKGVITEVTMGAAKGVRSWYDTSPLGNWRR
jgi:hypothetical protein